MDRPDSRRVAGLSAGAGLPFLGLGAVMISRCLHSSVLPPPSNPRSSTSPKDGAAGVALAFDALPRAMRLLGPSAHLPTLIAGFARD